MDPEDVETRLQAGADVQVVGLWTSADNTKVRPVFKGPKNGTYYLTKKSKRMLTDEQYVKMDKADVFARIAAYEAITLSLTLTLTLTLTLLGGRRSGGALCMP